MGGGRARRGRGRVGLVGEGEGVEGERGEVVWMPGVGGGVRDVRGGEKREGKGEKTNLWLLRERIQSL